MSQSTLQKLVGTLLSYTMREIGGSKLIKLHGQQFGGRSSAVSTLIQCLRIEIPTYEATRGSEPRIDILAYLVMLVIQDIPLGRMLANATTLLRLELESIEDAWKLVI
jgi:hypothetical protein